MKAPKLPGKSTDGSSSDDAHGTPGKKTQITAHAAMIPSDGGGKGEEKDDKKGELGKKALEALADKLKEQADKLSEIPKGERDAAIKELKKQDKQCGLTAHGRALVESASRKIAAYTMAKLLRELMLNARDMAQSSADLAHHGKLEDFVKSAIGGAKSLGSAMREFNNEMMELQEMVEGAGMNCQEKELEPEPVIKKLLVPHLNYVHIQGGDKGGDHTIPMPKLHIMGISGGLGILHVAGSSSSPIHINSSPTIAPSGGGGSGIALTA